MKYKCLYNNMILKKKQPNNLYNCTYCSNDDEGNIGNRKLFCLDIVKIFFFLLTFVLDAVSLSFLKNKGAFLQFYF